MVPGISRGMRFDFVNQLNFKFPVSERQRLLSWGVSRGSGWLSRFSAAANAEFKLFGVDCLSCDYA